MKFRKEILPFCKTIELPYLQNGFVVNNAHMGKRIPIPLPVIRDKIYAPNRYIKGLLLIRQAHGFRINEFQGIDTTYDDLIFLPYPFNLALYFHYLDVIATELRQWLKMYAPPRPQEIIIDVGAGCAETAWLYYHYFHPKQVISIEPDKDRFALLKANSNFNKWPNHVLINDVLKPEHFETDYLGLGKCTFAKIDIEGAEINFLDYPLPPFVMETHYQTQEPFRKKYKEIWNNHRGCSLVTNIN